MKIDLHSHILPGIDDGAKDVKESLELLTMLNEDGVDIVVATPHFYPGDMSVEDFLNFRWESYISLCRGATEYKKPLPRIVLGAEVYFSPSLNDIPLNYLCIQNTDYILLELPYQYFSTAFFNAFFDFVNFCDYKIILAHVERYFRYNEYSEMEKILSLDLIAQFNSDSILDRTLRKKFLKLLYDGRIHVMGSDTHNVSNRPPSFKAAENFLIRKYGKAEVNLIHKAAGMILANRKISDIIKLRA